MKPNIKIGLYLQNETAYNKTAFEKAMDIAKKADFDILVFPETCYCPEGNKIYNLNSNVEEDMKFVCSYVLDISERIDKAVVMSFLSINGLIYSIYANYKASEDETISTIYFKHTMTEVSAFDFTDYRDDNVYDNFDIIYYKGVKIGLSICYDCNHAIFSRMYGKQNVDIILNSTGGDVLYDKWYKYNKARAIENNCYNFVTMGGAGESENPKSYVYGFNRNGKELPFYNLMKKTENRNEINTIYVFDLSQDDLKAQEDTSLNQKPTVNKNSQLKIPACDVSGILEKARKIDENLYTLKRKDCNIIFCVIDNDDIFNCEKVLKLLYSPKLKRLKNKKYIILNRFEHLDLDFYKTKLSVLLKVRAMENFCAVILESDLINMCYQCGKNRTAQVLKTVNGNYCLDLTRMSGPEAIWKNKEGMRASWRDNFEWLIDECSKT